MNTTCCQKEKHFYLLAVVSILGVTMAMGLPVKEEKEEDIYILQCKEGYVMKSVTYQSKKHIGEGGFIVSVCCPEKSSEAVFFGREGVGCCPMKGERCIFTCQCKDNSRPVRSEKPTIINKKVKKSVFNNDR